LLPSDWNGIYQGIDLVPLFIQKAKSRFVNERLQFTVADMRLYESSQVFDWAIFISIRPMIQRNASGPIWDAIERNVRRIANRLLFLEYTVDDPGEIVSWKTSPENLKED
jgi:hypothetical protein